MRPGESRADLSAWASPRTAVAGLLTVIALVASSVVLFLVRSDAVTDVRGATSTVWLSGESLGRVVLGAPRNGRPSVAVRLAESVQQYDVVDTGAIAMVHDRLNGTTTILDGRDGTARATVSDAVIPTDARAALVWAGEVAYLVDLPRSTVRRIERDGTLGEPILVEDGFSDWVGTSDGRLWMLDDERGDTLVSDGTSVDRSEFAGPGADLSLTAVGADAVVLDRDNERIRWLRRGATVPVELDAAGSVLQDPMRAGDCVAVLSGGVLSCVGTEAVVRSTPLDVGDLTDVQVFSSATNAVVARRASAELTTVTWADGVTQTLTRPSPSPRLLNAWSTNGPILLDDPGSQYAVTVDRGSIMELDKLSKRTVLIDPDGGTVSGTGIGELDDSSDIAGVFSNPDGSADVPDDDPGRNDPPVASDDAAVTRVQRTVTVSVLTNDGDPDGDALQVVAVGAAAGAEVTIVGGTRIDVTPSAGAPVTFEYTIADPGGLEDTATVTVDVRSLTENGPLSLLPDTATTVVSAPVEIPVLANDTDPENDPLSIVALGTPRQGSASFDPSGLVRYEPIPGFIGTDSFSYTVTDGFGAEDSSNVTVTVAAPSAVNRAPVAVRDRASTVAGLAIRIPVLANDSDPDGDSIKVVSAAGLSDVSASVASGQYVDVVPEDTVAGLVTVSYTIEDELGLRSSAEVDVVVEAVTPNRPPRAVDDSYVASGPLDLDVLANDSDPDLDPIALVSLGAVPRQLVSVVQTSPSSLRVVPLAATGTAEFTYTVSDAFGLTATANVRIQLIAPTGAGPIARDDAVSAFPGEPVTVTPLANDTHPDGRPFDYAGAPLVRDAGATAVINSDKSLTFTPPDRELRSYTVTYTIQDATGQRSSADIVVSVVEKPITNQPPVAANDVATTAYETAVVIDVLTNDSDPDGDTLRIAGVDRPNSGDAAVVAGRIRYTPDPGFSGLATFSYEISDGVSDVTGTTVSGTVLVQVSERVQVPPIAVSDVVSLTVGDGVQIVRPQLNDIDPDGLANDLLVTSVTAPAGITAVLRPTQRGIDVTTPSTPGTYTLGYVVRDPDGLTASGTIDVVVSPPPNSPPVAAPNAYEILDRPTTLDVTANDIDPDGGSISLVSAGNVSPAGAASVDVSAGRVVFTPNGAGLVGFTYTIADDQGAQSTAAVTVTVSACPAAPVLSNITSYTPAGTPLDIEPFGAGGPGGTVAVGSPGAGVGTAAVVSQTSGTIRFTPAVGFTSVASFTYSVTTICNDVATASVSVDVNRAPVAGPNPVPVTTSKSTPVTVPVLNWASDAEGDALTVEVVSGSAVGGTATAASGGVLFTPTTGYTGPASFQYRVTDLPGEPSAPATVTLSIENQAPVPAADPRSVSTSVAGDATSVTIDVLTNDTDPDGDALSLVSADITGTTPLGLSATVSVVGDNVVVTPAVGGGPGVVSFSYVVTDGTTSATGTGTVTINNRPPIAGDTAVTVAAGTPSSPIDVLALSSDPDGPADVLSLVSVNHPWASSGAGGVVIDVPVGELAGTQVLIGYTIRDADGGVASGTITLTVA